MNAYHLPYSSLFIGCIILICVRFFLIVCLNYQQGVTRCCISYRQMRRGYKSKFTDKSKANLIWIHLELAKVHRLKGLTSPYIVSYLCFLNVNSGSPPNVCCRWSWVWIGTTYVRLVFCLPALHAWVLVCEIQTNASRLLSIIKHCTHPHSSPPNPIIPSTQTLNTR